MPQKRQWVPGHWGPVGAGGFKQWIPGRYVTVKTGKPVDRTNPRGGKGVSVSVGAGSDGYSGSSETSMEDEANRLADDQIGFQRAAILRAQAAAAARARGDASLLGGLGQAQMDIINLIPGNIQNIRNTGAQALAAYGGSIAQGEAQQLSGEQKANADFNEAQVGPAATATPAAGAIDPSKVAAATKALGADIPAAQQAEIGVASATAASGMPAVVARATQEQVAHRLAEAATEDADYRSQLVDLAGQRGGIYMEALDHLHSIEHDKFGEWEARQRLKLDQDQLKLQQRAQAANEKIAGVKLGQAQQSLDIRQGQLTLATQKEANDLNDAIAKGAKPNASLSKVYGYVVDSDGNPILNAAGQKIKVAKTSKPASGPKNGVSKANSMAAQMRGTPRDQYGERLPPKVSYQSAINQITNALIDMGYPPAQAKRMAISAVNAHYGPGVGGRPGSKKSGTQSGGRPKP
jgi:hypothetical protein